MTDKEQIIQLGGKVIRGHIKLLRQTIRELIPSSGQSRKVVAELRWQIYLSVMIADVATSVIRLAKTDDVRAMTILNRCLFEYRVKAEYFRKATDDAYEQYLSIPLT
jgi:hypothetical protein